MNTVFSINESVVINGNDMKIGDFGIIRKTIMNGMIKVGCHVIKAESNRLICLEDGSDSDKPELYGIEIKDQLKLQRNK